LVAGARFIGDDELEGAEDFGGERLSESLEAADVLP
jgi:hypothetical protein